MVVSKFLQRGHSGSNRSYFVSLAFLTIQSISGSDIQSGLWNTSTSIDHKTKSAKNYFYYNNTNNKPFQSLCVIDSQFIEEGAVILH